MFSNYGRSLELKKIRSNYTIYTVKTKLGYARTNFGKGKILFHQGKDEFGCVNSVRLPCDAFRVLGQSPDVVLFPQNCQGKAL